MVVVELPLWVVHTNAAPTKVPRPPGTSAAAGRAEESLSLLEQFSGTVKKAAVYSVDIHPKGHLFATGGGDGNVRLWSTHALFAKNRGKFASKDTYASSESSTPSGVSEDEKITAQESNTANDAASGAQAPAVHDLSNLVRRKKDGSSLKQAPTSAFKSVAKDAAKPKKNKKSEENDRHLCTLSAHTGSSVLAVRFSTAGDYLASAGDDACVCIYAPSSTNTSSFGSSSLESNVQQWSRIKLCRGHALDVVGLAWAPDDSHLVSCSLDSNSPIIVWKLTDLSDHVTQSNMLSSPYKTLGKDIHTSTVKGVTFDPAGTYLASSGDDPAVCIWRAHDDWGLEKKLDASSGIFRQWASSEHRELSSQTLFRRLSWSTDGTYICSTNATIKNKNVASTISREGWGVSAGDSPAPGTANLVGHKQPVVVARHCPKLLDAGEKGEENKSDGDGGSDDEPDYATLVALGDKRGFLTVWSTNKSRPIFKVQCSETRCTVTDLSWGRIGTKYMLLLVTLLDGNAVALRFAVPDDLGPLLSDGDQKRVFQLRYGIDLDGDDVMGRRRMFVGDNSAPKLIENTLQMTMEEQEEQQAYDLMDIAHERTKAATAQPQKQVESVSKSGKKRIRPVLMTVESDPDKKQQKKNGVGNGKPLKKKPERRESVLEAAAKAASSAADVNAQSAKQSGKGEGLKVNGGNQTQHQGPSNPSRKPRVETKSSNSPGGATSFVAQIPFSTTRIHSVELPLDGDEKVVADCLNVTKIPKGSSGPPVPCASLSVNKVGQASWKDDINGTSCTALSATKSLLAVGTSDGVVYLYGTSSSLGWKSITAFRSHPPLVFGQAVVALELYERNTSDEQSITAIEMLVVAADGMFGVYRLCPDWRVVYKGTVMPAMTHMVLSGQGSTNQSTLLPKLARIQVTEKGRLIMMLSAQVTNAQHGSGPGGSLQSFLYDRSLELWMRMADSRFVLSDFYSILPSVKAASRKGELARMDDAVRSGSSSGSIRAKRRSHDTSSMYGTPYGEGNVFASRSHCEDRMACAVALGSSQEFELWLVNYVKALSMGGFEDQLRLLVDLIVGDESREALSNTPSCWWLSSAPQLLGFERKTLLRRAIIPEMSKNRALQRLTNEIALQLDSM